MTDAPATAAEETLNPDRLICSSITLRHLPLEEALPAIAKLGFTEIDLGALPGVCDHVPYELTSAAVRNVADTVRQSGLTVRSVNADVGDLNRPLDAQQTLDRHEHVQRLIELCKAVGSTGLVLPNGAQQHEPFVSLDDDLALVAEQLVSIQQECSAAGLELWVEAPHFFRLCYNIERADALTRLLPDELGLICDVSHIVASGATPRRFIHDHADRIRHVHLRDAEPGYIHHSIGNGQVDFADTAAALAEVGYTGKLSLELETRDVTNDERPAAALKAGRYISSLL
ncbi:MAG TPA: sugar phosphate isomerase/epimerase [Propionibacteriaceae bacterium]|nr:sugar phosphate isomerase/epimerase [Propionibacteriaceae bacterium]